MSAHTEYSQVAPKWNEHFSPAHWSGLARMDSEHGWRQKPVSSY